MVRHGVLTWVACGQHRCPARLRPSAAGRLQQETAGWRAESWWRAQATGARVTRRSHRRRGVELGAPVSACRPLNSHHSCAHNQRIRRPSLLCGTSLAVLLLRRGITHSPSFCSRQNLMPLSARVALCHLPLTMALSPTTAAVHDPPSTLRVAGTGCVRGDGVLPSCESLTPMPLATTLCATRCVTAKGRLAGNTSSLVS